MRSLLTWCVLGGAVAVAMALGACSDDEQDRANEQANGAGGTGTGTGTTGGGGTGGTTSGGGGTGGTEPCGGTCTDPTPLCDENSNTCVECLGPSDCGGATPACNAAGTCVQCTPTDDAECTGANPYCDPATFTCAPCSYHEHCPDSACNVFTGECLTATPQTIGPSGDFQTIATAFASVNAGQQGVFRISPDTGNAPYAEDLQVANRTIALLGENGRPTLQGISFPPLTVASDATLLLAGLDLRNSSAAGLSTAGLVALDAVEVASNDGGGITATANSAEILIRNSIVAATTNDVNAISMGGATLTLLYSSVGGSYNSAAVSCTANHDLTIRNSIIFNRDAGPTLDACANATVTYSAADETLSGTGNEQVTMDASLFVGLSTGNLRLLDAGRTAFTDIALWQTGDPPTDIDGTARPTTDGTPDVCGADEGP